MALLGWYYIVCWLALAVLISGIVAGSVGSLLGYGIACTIVALMFGGYLLDAYLWHRSSRG